MTTELFVKKRGPPSKIVPEQTMERTTIPVPRWESESPIPQPPVELSRKHRPRDRADLVSGK